jgi:flagellar protein FliJ
MFKYRLERVLELREQELEKAKTDFQEAIAIVKELKQKLAENKIEQLETQNQLSKPDGLTAPILYLNRLNYLKSQKDILEEEIIEAEKALEIVKEKMIEAQQKTEVLKKHKDKQKKLFLFNELKAEEKEFNELALTMRRQNQEKNGELEN